ncbi:MAG: hypothetical protein KDC27_13005 [Acidobacteria bacterium]|nr:hypothetical protein [Acidobacteriota bacterium]
MKVFLSWSGDLSHKLACVFREWLPSVVQSVQPYVSSEDIDKGARWSTDIAKELDSATFGVLFVTRQNLAAPWVHFEAGALSKTIDKAFVSPFLFGVKRSEVQGPLLQFQSTISDRDDVLKLVKSINARCPDGERLSVDRLEKAFQVWWPELEKGLSGLESDTTVDAPKATPHSANAKVEAMLEEILELTRRQQRILAEPETLIPAGYLRSALRTGDNFGGSRRRVLELRSMTKRLLDVLQGCADIERPEITLALAIANDLNQYSADMFARSFGTEEPHRMSRAEIELLSKEMRRAGP